MSPLKKTIKSIASFLGVLRVKRSLDRRAFAMSYYSEKLAYLRKWSWMETENSNFYYKLSPINRDHLAHLVSIVTNKPYDTISGYFDELDSDAQLRKHLTDGIKGSTYGRDIEIDYGRRLGWYAFVRCLKPKVIVETGVDHGVGSCVLGAALLRNGEEGHPGRYYGTDIRLEAGQLLAGRYAEVGKILYGDSITSLKGLDAEIDLFINDSDHSSEYEYQEYLTVAGKLAAGAVILGDNSHVTGKLSQFSRETGRKFVFFSEKPDNHWYPGGGIGISFGSSGQSRA